MLSVKVLNIKDNESVILLKIENRRRISALFFGETKLSYKTPSFFLFKWVVVVFFFFFWGGGGGGLIMRSLKAFGFIFFFF
jgi:hypothetical protein